MIIFVYFKVLYMGTASVRKRRNHSAITSSSESFGDSISRGNFDDAAKIVLSAALKVIGEKGLLNAMNEGKNQYQRKSRRRGL